MAAATTAGSAAGGTNAAGAAQFGEHFTEPIDTNLYVPCANGGAGEDVYVTGTLHTNIRWTVTPEGGVRGMWHENPQDMSGIGQSTGLRYLASGTFQSPLMIDPGETIAITGSFRLVSTTSAPDMHLHSVQRMRFVDGDPVAWLDHLRITCD